MATVATAPGSTTEAEPTTTPSPRDPVDSELGLDDDLVAAAFEDLDDDPIVATLQTDRDRLAARGDFDAAHAHHQQVLELRSTREAAARSHAFDAMCESEPAAGEVEA